MNAIRRESDDHRGESSRRGETVIGWGSPPSVETSHTSELRKLVFISAWVTTNATCLPSGEIRGSLTTRRLITSSKVIARRDCAGIGEEAMANTASKIDS